MLLLSIAFSFSLRGVPNQELPATFDAGRVFAMPLVANSDRRLVLLVGSDGSGFIRSELVKTLGLQTTPPNDTYLPELDGRSSIPAPNANHGALPILTDVRSEKNAIMRGIDGELGWSWLAGRIWTFDYVGKHLYRDYSAPSYRNDEIVPLQFDPEKRYPRIQIAVAHHTYSAALDTAAAVALSQAAYQEMDDGLPRIRATSFISRPTMALWHAEHPLWTYIANAGVQDYISMIRVPEVSAAHVTFHNVWFSTPPNDDVFEGTDVVANLGADAFGMCATTIDYVHEQAAFRCSGT